MIKFNTIGAFSNAVTYPDIRAHMDMGNYGAVAVDQAQKVTAWAVAGTSAKDLCIVMQNLWNTTGDLYFGDKVLHEGDTVLCVQLASLSGRFLEVGAGHIAGGLDADGALAVSVGDTLVPDGNGQWKVGVAPEGGMRLLVTGLTTLPKADSAGKDGMTEPAVVAQVVAAQVSGGVSAV
jgi:hypothetical protein